MTEDKTTQKALNIVLIDDNHIDNLINRKILEKTKFVKSIQSFINPEKALEYLQKLTSHEEPDFPDILLIDINMPVMNGFEFLNKYDKLADNIKNNISVYILSSSINTSDKERANNNPYVIKYLIKPLKIEELFAV